MFGSAGIKILSSRDAKKVYTHCTAAALRAKDSVMDQATILQENCSDIYEEAKAINDSPALSEADVGIAVDTGKYKHIIWTGTATDLNKKAYLFRDDPPSIKVFFKTESSNVKQLVGSKAGSIFSPGSLALGIGIGAVIGALIMGLIMRRRKVKIVDA